MPQGLKLAPETPENGHFRAPGAQNRPPWGPGGTPRPPAPPGRSPYIDHFLIRGCVLIPRGYPMPVGRVFLGIFWGAQDFCARSPGNRPKPPRNPESGPPGGAPGGPRGPPGPPGPPEGPKTAPRTLILAIFSPQTPNFGPRTPRFQGPRPVFGPRAPECAGNCIARDASATKICHAGRNSAHFCLQNRRFKACTRAEKSPQRRSGH